LNHNADNSSSTNIEGGAANGSRQPAGQQQASTSSFGFVNFRNSSQRQSGFSNNQAGLNSRGADPKYMFVGLCQVNENHSMEDTHKSQNSMLLNLLDSNFWSNGNQIQNFYGGTKNIKIKNPFEH
jgi:hypothetical protein